FCSQAVTAQSTQDLLIFFSSISSFLPVLFPSSLSPSYHTFSRKKSIHTVYGMDAWDFSIELSVFRSDVFDAEADSSHLVFSKADCLDFVSQCQNIFYVVDALFADLGNVNHSL